MKTLLKILILCVACVIAIGGVMMYQKTQVSPPAKPKTIQAYDQNIRQGLRSVPLSHSQQQADSIFDVLSDRIKVFGAEQRLEPGESDIKTRALLAIYSPVFLSTSLKTFYQPEWLDSDHQWMLSRIDAMKALRMSDTSMALRESTLDSLNMIISIIDDYHDALQLSTVSEFRGWDNAVALIDSARNFSTNRYLSNNRELVEALNGIKGRLAESCYGQLTKKVEQLSGYRGVGQNYFEKSLVPYVENAIRDYESHAPIVFGSKYPTGTLWNHATDYCRKAMDYYIVKSIPQGM